MLTRIVEAGLRGGFGRREEKDGGPGKVLTFDEVGIVRGGSLGCVKRLESQVGGDATVEDYGAFDVGFGLV